MKAWREAKEAADDGVLRQAADLTRAASTEDGYARGVIGTLTEGLWGLPMNFLGDPRMIDALTDTPTGSGQWREMFPQPEAIRLMSWGINLGVGVGQMRHKWREPGEQAVSVEDAATGEFRIVRPLRPIGAHSTRVLRTWDPKWLRHQWWDDTWWLMTADREIRITPNDGEWILYMPYGSQKPWEQGAWKALTLAFILGRDAMFDESRHAEVLAPVRVGKVPQGTTQRQRQEYLRQIREMQRMAAFVLPPGLDYSIVESTGRITEIYEKIIARCERQYCLIYTGNETTTKGTSGFSQGDVQERIASSKLKSFSGSLSICLRDGGLREWAIENYGTADAPLALFDCEPPEDKLAKAKTVSEAGDSLGKMNAGLATAGLRVTKASATAYAQSFGFAVEELPVAAAPAPEAEPPVAQGDLAKALRADEIRALAGIPAFGDERGDMVLSALNAPPAPPGGAPFAADPKALAPLAPIAAPVATVAESDDAPDTSAAAALAAKMTLHGVARCEHERPNRCLLCGVERTRDFDAGAGPDGGHVWRVAWRPIGGTVAPVAEPAVASLAMGYNPDQDRADDGTFGEGAGAHGGGAKADHESGRSKAHANALEEHGNDAAREQRRALQLTPKLSKAKERRDAASARYEKLSSDESAYNAHEAAKSAHEETPTKATAAALKKAAKDLDADRKATDGAESERAATQSHYESLKERTAVAQARAVTATEHHELLKLPHDQYVARVEDRAAKADYAERSAKANLEYERHEGKRLSDAYKPSEMSQEAATEAYRAVEASVLHEKEAAARHMAAAESDSMWRGYAEDAKDFDTRYGDDAYETRASRQLAAGRDDELEAALIELSEALAALEALGPEDQLAAGYNPDQDRADDGKFGSGGGGAKADKSKAPAKDKAPPKGTKDGLGTSKASKEAKPASNNALAASAAAKGGSGSHDDAAKMHAEAAAKHLAAAKSSRKPEYKAAHQAAADAHTKVAEAHRAEHAAKAPAVAPQATPVASPSPSPAHRDEPTTPDQLKESVAVHVAALPKNDDWKPSVAEIKSGVAAAVSHIESKLATMPDHEVDAVNGFSNGHDYEMRALERGATKDDLILTRVNKGESPVIARAHVEKSARLLPGFHEAQERLATTTPPPPALARGMAASDKTLHDLLTKNSFTNTGMSSSSSLNPQIGIQFAEDNIGNKDHRGDETKHKVVLLIHAAKSAPIMHKDLSVYANTEKEQILDRRSTYDITHRSTDSDGIITIHMKQRDL